MHELWIKKTYEKMKRCIKLFNVQYTAQRFTDVHTTVPFAKQLRCVNLRTRILCTINYIATMPNTVVYNVCYYII